MPEHPSPLDGHRLRHDEGDRIPAAATYASAMPVFRSSARRSCAPAIRAELTVTLRAQIIAAPMRHFTE
jgi:hypothetical protein